jgi:hypothetical protein
MAWSTEYYYDNEGEIIGDMHVVPIDDDEEHELIRTCHCKPTVTAIDDMTLMIIHNSFDGREAYEEAMRILDDDENYD